MFAFRQIRTTIVFKEYVRICVKGKNGIRNVHPSIHPSFYTRLIQFRVLGGLEPIPAVIRREAGFTLDRSPVHHRATQTNEPNNHTLTHTPKDNLESPLKLTGMFLDGGRRSEYTGRTCRLHTERPQLGIDPGPLCCEATVLTTTPPGFLAPIIIDLQLLSSSFDF